jgi:predicted lipoprotein with Yx(FWY)xxD motif
MTRRTAAGTALACIVVLAAASLWWLRRDPETSSSQLTTVEFATPPGITLQALAPSPLTPFGTAPAITYADADGMTLYTYDHDTDQVASCTGDCAKQWLPAIPPPQAVATADWSIVSRADGLRQWAHQGQPLYRAADDSGAGTTNSRISADGPWRVALFRPFAGMALPADVMLRDVGAGGGIALTDSVGITLYAFFGDANNPQTSREWLPLEAPTIGSAIGDFTVLARDDGISQWAWRKLPLYRFDADQNASDVHGAAVDARFRVALLLRDYMPSEVARRWTPDLGHYLVTANGVTLYARNRAPQTEVPKIIGAHRGSPMTGRALGTASCDDVCTRRWKPLLAPGQAIASGYWDILKRPSDERQWAYKGFALYTYIADKPGDRGGHGVHDLVQIGDTRADYLASGRDSAASAGLGIGALYWHAVAP